MVRYMHRPETCINFQNGPRGRCSTILPSSSIIRPNSLCRVKSCRQLCKDMKTPTACTQCRQGKRRCTIRDDSPSCNECLRRNAACSLTSKAPALPPSKRPILAHRVYQPAEELASDQTIRVELGRLYISLIHDKPHTLFHPPTFMQQLEDGLLPPKIMYGVFAMVARYVLFDQGETENR